MSNSIGLINIISSVLLDYYSIAMIALFMHCFCDEEILWNQKKSRWTVGCVICNELVELFVGNSSLWIELVVVAVIILFGCKGKYIKRFLLCAYVYFVICFMYAGIMLMGIAYFFPNMRTVSNDDERWYLITLLLAAFFAFCYYRIKSMYLKKEVHIRFRKKEYVFLGAYSIFIMLMYALLSIAQEDTELGQGIYSFLVIILIVFCVIMPLYMIRGQVSNYYQGVKEYQELFLQEQLKLLEQHKAAEEETKRARHDMKNNLACIVMLLQSEKVQEATAYAENLLQEIQALSPKVITGDEMLNCIFSAKLEWMQKEGIQFEIDGVLDRGLNWKPMDICKVFANAIDNAIEACIKIEKREHRKIKVTLKRTKQFYSIEMTNSVADEKLCEPILNQNRQSEYTTKAEKKYHGLGLASMRSTVEKYGGMMKMSCENGMFLLHIVV